MAADKLWALKIPSTLELTRAGNWLDRSPNPSEKEIGLALSQSWQGEIASLPSTHHFSVGFFLLQQQQQLELTHCTALHLALTHSESQRRVAIQPGEDPGPGDGSDRGLSSSPPSSSRIAIRAASNALQGSRGVLVHSCMTINFEQTYLSKLEDTTNIFQDVLAAPSTRTPLPCSVQSVILIYWEPFVVVEMVMKSAATAFERCKGTL